MNHPTSGTGPDTAAGTGTDVGTDAWARSGASPAPDGEDATGTGLSNPTGLDGIAARG